MKKKMLKYLAIVPVVAFSVVCFNRSNNRIDMSDLFEDNVSALVRQVTDMEVVKISGVEWTPQYVDRFDDTDDAKWTGPSHSLNPEDYPSSPVPKPGGGFYSECANLVYVKKSNNEDICYGRLLNLTPSFLR